MNKHFTTGLIALACLAGFQNSAMAYDDDFADRLRLQQERIEIGYEEGSLTHREFRKLTQQNDEIRFLAERFGRDGYYSDDEHDILSSRLDKANRRIHTLKHNHKIASRPVIKQRAGRDVVDYTPTERVYTSYPSNRTSYSVYQDSQTGYLTGTAISTW